MVTMLIIFIIGSFLASFFVISAGMLSSRLNQSQVMSEEYETMMVQQSGRNFISRTYPVEIKA
jgi:hypothetical protein